MVPSVWLGRPDSVTIAKALFMYFNFLFCIPVHDLTKTSERYHSQADFIWPDGSLKPIFVPGTGRESIWMRTWNSGGRRHVAPSTIRRSAPARTSPSPWPRSSGLAHRRNGRHGWPPPPPCRQLISVADPDPGSGAFLTPWSGMEKFGFEINIPDPRHCSRWDDIFEDYALLEIIFWSFCHICVFFCDLKVAAWFFLVTAPFWLICSFYLHHDIW